MKYIKISEGVEGYLTACRRELLKKQQVPNDTYYIVEKAMREFSEQIEKQGFVMVQK